VELSRYVGVIATAKALVLKISHQVLELRQPNLPKNGFVLFQTHSVMDFPDGITTGTIPNVSSVSRNTEVWCQLAKRY